MSNLFNRGHSANSGARAHTNVLHLDFETFNTLDIGDVGAWVYSRSPTLEVTVAAWAFGEGEVKSARLLGRGDLPNEITDHIAAGGKLAAHNANFELCILENYFGVAVPFRDVICTMQKAVYAGLPKSLLDAGRVAGAAEIKDETAKKVMQKLAKPRAGTKKRPQSKWHEDQPELLDILEEYCRQDVRAERALDRMLPELPAGEFEITVLDREINRRGLKFDRAFIEAMIRVVESTGHEEAAAVEKITQGAVTNVATQTARIMQWMDGRGPASLGKEIIEDFLTRDNVDADIRTVLEARVKGAKSSVAKLYTALDWMDERDDRARGLLQYYGARTGRFCLAEGSLILVTTKTGEITEKPIEEVLHDDLVWDGIEWVAHEGVVFSGEKDVIEHDGVVATPEHIVWISEDKKMPLGETKEKELSLWGGHAR